MPIVSYSNPTSPPPTCNYPPPSTLGDAYHQQNNNNHYPTPPSGGHYNRKPEKFIGPRPTTAPPLAHLGHDFPRPHYRPPDAHIHHEYGYHPAAAPHQSAAASMDEDDASFNRFVATSQHSQDRRGLPYVIGQHRPPFSQDDLLNHHRESSAAGVGGRYTPPLLLPHERFGNVHPTVDRPLLIPKQHSPDDDMSPSHDPTYGSPQPPHCNYKYNRYPVSGSVSGAHQKKRHTTPVLGRNSREYMYPPVPPYARFVDQQPTNTSLLPASRYNNDYRLNINSSSEEIHTSSPPVKNQQGIRMHYESHRPPPQYYEPAPAHTLQHHHRCEQGIRYSPPQSPLLDRGPSMMKGRNHYCSPNHPPSTMQMHVQHYRPVPPHPTNRNHSPSSTAMSSSTCTMEQDVSVSSPRPIFSFKRPGRASTSEPVKKQRRLPPKEDLEAVEMRVFRSLTESIVDMITLIDTTPGSNDERIGYANPAFTCRYKYPFDPSNELSEGKMMPSTFMQLVHDDDVLKLRHAIASVKADNTKAPAVEFRMLFNMAEPNEDGMRLFFTVQSRIQVYMDQRRIVLLTRRVEKDQEGKSKNLESGSFVDDKNRGEGGNFVAMSLSGFVSFSSSGLVSESIKTEQNTVTPVIEDLTSVP